MTRFAQRLSEFIVDQPPLAIALSGGVDSLTLAWAAHLARPESTIMVHAVSPAVPPDATHLVKHYAKKAGWQLHIIDAKEYQDPRYIQNPINRCYFCKTNLYARIKAVTGLTIASGTNTDDLGDFRPGLKAATEHNVIHPYVEVGIDKTTIRDLATSYGLNDVAILPAQPCLASRVETGIRIDAKDLTFINTMESMVRKQLDHGDIRCRLTSSGVKLEIDSALLGKSATGSEIQKTSIKQLAQELCARDHRHFIGLVPYTRGSAFVQPSPLSKKSV